MEKNLIEELGLDNLSEEQRDELVAKFAELLQVRIANRVMDVLSDEEKQEFDVIAEDDEKAQAFISERVPGVGEITADEYEKLKSELVSEKNDIQKLLKK